MGSSRLRFGLACSNLTPRCRLAFNLSTPLSKVERGSYRLVCVLEAFCAWCAQGPCEARQGDAPRGKHPGPSRPYNPASLRPLQGCTGSARPATTARRLGEARGIGTVEG